jgi:hypothetical protein
MSKAVTVTGKIDVAGKSVTLSAEQDGARLPSTFVLDNDHTVTWRLRDAKVPTKTAFEGFKVRVRFVKFPTNEKRPLLKRGSALDAAPDGVISGGSVNPDAANGEYRYAVELVGPGDTVTNLECSWAGLAPGDPPVVVGMGGIKREGGP